MKPIHPFPARMAPDAISAWVETLPPESVVLDPMCGSGVVLRQALLAGHKAVGFDLDPLAVLMSRVWTSSFRSGSVERAKLEALEIAQTIRLDHIELPWIDECSETKDFVRYWFAGRQKNQLRKLSFALSEIGDKYPVNVVNVLWLALSRTIITKHTGASLAWDVSHSRPHRVRTDNDFDVFDGFSKAVGRILEAHGHPEIYQPSRVRGEDARNLRYVRDSSVDAIFTSPPYLNAIDYLRGHKFSLIWMGYSIPELREIRSGAIGSERAVDDAENFAVIENVFSSEKSLRELDIRMQNVVKRYIADAHRLIVESKRVLKKGGKLGLVIGDSEIRGVFVKNSRIFCRLAEREGFTRLERKRRDIMSSRRYLPENSSNNSLEKRMRHEILQLFSIAS